MEDAQSSVSSQQDSADTMRSVLQEIRDFRAEHKVDLNKLKEEIKGDMKSELKDMKQEIYQKLSANSALTQAHETRLKEAEKRIDEAETVNMTIAQDAAQELRRRGFSVEIPDRNASELYPEMERLHQTKTWQRIGERIPPETN
ncbi:hypothetical protein KUCAC02_015972 [Chaenocephalus aceratus]|uniref:Uncharacterized protein n=1 Tax=Chaenocephalus aceratus TaxID=36190 RepID=A0ACB9Y0P7_CHAAC|nr:hypothetical protein KUCAC02_015972 [Chaenocephalus aceratus]